MLRTDNGAEFFSHECRDYLIDNKILHQRSCPHISQQNRVVERRHRYVLEVARALRFQQTAFLNPSRKIFSYEVFHKKPPSLVHLRIVRCLCFSTVTEKVDKFSPRTITAVHMGYSISQKGYKLYVFEKQKVLCQQGCNL